MLVEAGFLPARRVGAFAALFVVDLDFWRCLAVFVVCSVVGLLAFS